MASKLKYPGELYQPTWKFLKENFTEAEMKREYSRLRDIAQKRIARMGETEFARSATYEQNVGRFPVLSTFKGEHGRIRNKAAFARSLSQLARFVESPISTTRGQRAIQSQTIQTLQDRGYTFVNKSNYWDFLNYMEEARARKLDRIYDSERIAGLYRSARRKGVDPKKTFDDFDRYMKNKKALDELKTPSDRSDGGSDKLDRETRSRRRK